MAQPTTARCVSPAGVPYNDRFDEDSLVPVTVGAITGGYRVTVEDMDPNSHIVSFTTSGVITGSNAGTPDQKTFGTVGGTDEVTVRFSPQGSTTLTRTRIHSR